MLFMLLASAVLADPPFRGGIRERLDTPPTFTFHTAKKPVDLELCVADVLHSFAEPSALPDGPERVVVIATSGVAIELNGSSTETTVIGHVAGKGWNDRFRERISSCL